MMKPTLQRAAVKLLPLPYLADSLQYFHTIAAHLPMPVILQSDTTAQPNHNLQKLRGRFDIISAAPEYCLQSNNKTVTWSGDQPSFMEKYTCADSFSVMRSLVAEMLTTEVDYSAAMQQQLPFCGGLIGYCSYDLAREYAAFPFTKQKDIDAPEMQWGFYAWACTQDHQEKKSWLVIHPTCQDSLAKRLPTLLRSPYKNEKNTEPSAKKNTELTSNLTFDQYADKFSTIQHYIHAGDCYQINFAQRFSGKTSLSALDVYTKLRTAMPSPFCAYLPIYSDDDSAILSFSPERFVQLSAEGIATTQPIKGTAARHSDVEVDQAIGSALQNDPKNIAENLMIVDLLRNDLGKVCETGSVIVKKLFELQSFSNVHHLVSTIDGKLQAGLNGADLLQACFPGGSITGAPKNRAMQIIDEIEPNSRSIYCGNIMLYSAHGAMDSSILIRTLLIKNDELFCWGGGGIVADSECQSEYQESLTKIRALLDMLQGNTQA